MSKVVYSMNMRKAISITLGEENLLWLRAQALKSAKGSISEVLDRLVAEARTSGRVDPASMRSVVGTVDLPDDDPDLAGADAYVRSLFAASAQQLMVVRESGAKRARKARRG